MKKKILISILIVLSFITAIKLSEIIIMHNVSKSIEQFKEQENRYYCITENIENETKIKKERYFEKNIEKYVLTSDTIGEYCEIKNFEKREYYSYNLTNRIKYNSNINLKNKNNIMYLPRIISVLYDSNYKKLSQLLKIHYIIPITYENKPCYKISTDFETVIIDKKTYLPVYSAVKTVNSSEGDNITEYFYKFEVGTVTDEDVALPDFCDYTIE